MGKLDNTLVIYISGDNGNSAEGTLVGTPNEVASLNGVEIPIIEQLTYYEAWGSDGEAARRDGCDACRGAAPKSRAGPHQTFTGKLDKLTLTIDRPQLTPEDEQRLKEAQRDNKTSE